MNMEAKRSSERQNRLTKEQVAELICERLQGKTPAMVAVLGRSIVKRKGSNGGVDTFVATPYITPIAEIPDMPETEDRQFSFHGGKARALATACVAKVFPDTPVMVFSKSKQKKYPEEPSHARVMKGAISRLGIEKDRFLLHEESLNTIHEIEAIIQNAQKNHWQEVVVVTSDFHIKRAALLAQNTMQEEFHANTTLNYDDSNRDNTALITEDVLKDANDFPNSATVVGVLADHQTLTLRFVGAESILAPISRHYASVIVRAKAFQEEGQSPYQALLVDEQKGIDDFLQGHYQSRITAES
ncbi:MAG: hypothetical protein A2233_03915 [Candidatus Kerfeldbacteria bacterium RIFOXYA2_FULL_38_24]|uniref:DUF218 domain-containing protein n=1 Tax=Candidatus Kerfeldbacteria bacterium RIFOXYB2_FULL_38_14 TaxID=1798547 RepID=A0A1G2BDA2_9BACT|nr:MAG: hypothetical protein A2233_03915 [Candidatus Kerfeldbacteria bacterium RIFOXYA2_FULL_38_24]OGY87213.1 MAG: hypothetical protein A2319_01035 [Candidatus Kerfeldbacteria bacterium RIFOXYB2_FULL_38_14]OGY88479.1 MAG: hypothetical protein A2458_01745 [Candidatus Kerfeldbacteria bacterium RIFOXYC2_FULL_38_9]